MKIEPLSKRSQLKEWMDLGCYSEKEYQESLEQLSCIGRCLGGDAATFSAFHQIKKPLTSILDVGCGGGLFTIRLAERYPHAKVVGIDISHEAIAYAEENRTKSYPHLNNIEFIFKSELDFEAKSFDVVTSTLVCHHLSDENLIAFLKNSYMIAKEAIILNDLHRHSIAKRAYTLIAPLLGLNQMVVHDGLISIDRGFLYKEWLNYINAAHISLNQVSIKWKWAFRWIVTIHV